MTERDFQQAASEARKALEAEEMPSDVDVRLRSRLSGAKPVGRRRLYPVLGADSDVRSRAIWCTKDAMASWRRWMIDGVAPLRAMGECDTGAIERNVAFGRKHRINGTPALVFEDGVRVPGAMSAADLEKRLVEARRPKG